jgi:hypothetical protein
MLSWVHKTWYCTQDCPSIKQLEAIFLPQFIEWTTMPDKGKALAHMVVAL